MYLPNIGYQGCIAALHSVTLAIKAQRALNAENISAEVITLNASETRRGCAYGLSFPCNEESRVRALLRAARIPVSQYLRKGGSPP